MIAVLEQLSCLRTAEHICRTHFVSCSFEGVSLCATQKIVEKAMIRNGYSWYLHPIPMTKKERKSKTVQKVHHDKQTPERSTISQQMAGRYNPQYFKKDKDS